MGWWADQVVPRIVNKTCNAPEMREIRARVCADLHGDVLELGFGSGLNLRWLPQGVRSLSAVEPSGVGFRLAQDRIARSEVPVRLVGLDGARLQVESGSVDAVLTTWTLCTIPDVLGALREARRVLKPGGTLHFAEHGLSPDASIARWQRRLDPVQKRLAAGCHLSRPIDLLLRDAGFAIERLDRYYAPKVPKVLGAMYEGVGRTGSAAVVN